MPHRHYRGFAALVAVLLIGVVLPWAYAQSAGPVTPGASLAGIPLGAPIPEVVHRLGAPSAVRLVSQDGTLAYVFGQYGIIAYARDNSVIAVSTTNSTLGTVRGIALGAPESVVIGAFGRPRGAGVVEGFPGLLYESLGIAFGFDRHSVAVVMIFAPRSVATPSSPAPQPAPAVTTQASPDGIATPEADTQTAETPPEAPAPAVGPRTPETHPEASPVEPGTDAAMAAPDSPAALPGPPMVLRPAVEGAAGGIPDVSHLRPFTAETRFLSIAGYMRYLVYTITRQWVAVAETIQQMIRTAEGMPAPGATPIPGGIPMPAGMPIPGGTPIPTGMPIPEGTPVP